MCSIRFNKTCIPLSYHPNTSKQTRTILNWMQISFNIITSLTYNSWQIKQKYIGFIWHYICGAVEDNYHFVQDCREGKKIYEKIKPSCNIRKCWKLVIIIKKDNNGLCMGVRRRLSCYKKCFPTPCTQILTLYAYHSVTCTFFHYSLPWWQCTCVYTHAPCSC